MWACDQCRVQIKHLPSSSAFYSFYKNTFCSSFISTSIDHTNHILKEQKSQKKWEGSGVRWRELKALQILECLFGWPCKLSFWGYFQEDEGEALLLLRWTWCKSLCYGVGVGLTPESSRKIPVAPGGELFSDTSLPFEEQILP